MASRRGGSTAAPRRPMASPAIIEPTPHRPSMTPVSSRWPVASSAAGTATSTAPTDRPQSTKTAMSTRTPGPRSAPVRSRVMPRVRAPRARDRVGGEGEVAGEQEGRAGGHGDAGRPRADAGDDDERAADVDDLEQRALHRVGGVAAVRAVEQDRPQRAHARADRRLGGAGDGRGGEDRAERGAVGKHGQHDDRGGRQRRSEAQDERLPAAVDDAGEGRVGEAERDRVGARREAALGVGPGELLGVQDEQQPERAHGQPRHARGDEEGEGARSAQDVTHARQGDDRRRARETIRLRPYPWPGSARPPRGRAGCACSRARRRSRSASRRCR